MKRWAVVCWALLALAWADRCPDDGICEQGQTCCNNPANYYECCPFDQAECCEDHLHCCPAGTICNVAKSSCVNSTASIPWVKRIPADQPLISKSFRMIRAYMGEIDENICPDKSRCPPEFSCLKALTGFGCCPLSQGVSCSDGKHCCPEDHQCSADSRSCIKKELVTTVLCGDGVSECPDGTTCCETPEGKWGCCPMPKAVCCEDKLHCCPEGSTCDLKHSKCISLSTQKVMPMWDKLPARIRADWENQIGEQMTAQTADNIGSEKNIQDTTTNTISPLEKEVSVSSVTKAVGGNYVPCNETVACNDGTTCCKTKEGGWACCPLPEAVCCDDFEHCCPKGKICNTAAESCDDPTSTIPWLRKIPPIAIKGVQVGDVTCDSTTSCPDETTCCKTKEGGWACCPLPEAVCCDDFEHCCPKGKICNLPEESCDDPTGTIPWLRKMPPIPIKGVQVGDVTCDSTTSCPDETTCCKTKEGGWACCPLPEAVCCDDFEHCCPKGKICNLPEESCDDPTGTIPWLRKMPPIPIKGVQVGDVTCDSTTSCPDETTCCKTKEGGWACCPLPEAVCCDDFEHCCPKGKICNLPEESCDDPTGTIPWLRKMPPIANKGVQVGNVTCDSKASCPDEMTCCKNKTGDWACCPLPEAVCCDDHEHCCPADTTCDLATLSCQTTISSIPSKLKMPAFTKPAPTTVATTTQSQVTEEEKNDVEERIPCDQHTSCPRDTTCCFMASAKRWGCCPLPQAVCCTDGTHCCPKGYKCNDQKTSCIKGELVIPWYTKLPAITSIQAHPGTEQCDAVNQCPEGTTCCQLSSGQWSCCPLPNAVCCPDKEHCCPEGYTCNIASKTCQKLVTVEVDTVPLTPVCLPEHQPNPDPFKFKDIQCDEKTSCQDGETCCKMSATTWGCCPLPNAVCCSDMLHCCPTGYTCTETGDCTQDTKLHWFNWDVFFTNKKRALIV
ncbi:granulin a [Channa argus]|uniref:granulin a n=1 Tax=Channa argus TaxID=215402 RepID=UPI0035221FC3